MRASRTIACRFSSTRNQVVEKEDDEEENPSCLQISGSLTLRHPGVFDFLQRANCAIGAFRGVVSSYLLVRIVANFTHRQRYRCTSHKGASGEILSSLSPATLLEHGDSRFNLQQREVNE